VNIYEVHNNGNWYNFGFVLGVSVAFGGASRSGSASRAPRRLRRSGPATEQAGRGETGEAER
jgi:hypothetical protein